MLGKYEFDIAAKNKQVVFMQAARILFKKDLRLIDLDNQRPWGFFLSVDETQAQEFIEEFYSDAELQGVDASLPLRPKFLGIQPNKRLSWQYHHRRAEIWRCLAGEFNLVTSDTDDEDHARRVSAGEIVSMPQGMRHRGVGLGDWALIAEIWQHTDITDPSNEDDIVRVQDDFGR